jgi:hypothetical protein
MARAASLIGIAVGALVLSCSFGDVGLTTQASAIDLRGSAGSPPIHAASAPGKRLALLSLFQPAIQSKAGDVTNTAGAECPTGSGNYCSDELPYCCPGVSVDPYCAADVNGCTQ